MAISLGFLSSWQFNQVFQSIHIKITFFIIRRVLYLLVSILLNLAMLQNRANVRFPDFCGQFKKTPLISGFRAANQLRTARFWDITQRAVVNFLPTFRDNQSVPSSVFKNPTEILDSWKKKMMLGTIGCPETSVINYHYQLRNRPEEGSFRF